MTSKITTKLFNINEEIKAREVRVVDENGNMLGVKLTREAITLAREVGLDLVEVSPNAEPPVCKIANFGKMKYELQKKASDAKRKQKVVETKEIKMSFNIGKGDYDIKVKKIEEFVKKGHKVRVSIKMRGREITHLDLAKKMMEDVVTDSQGFAKPETTPKLEGNQMVAIFIKK